MNDHNERTTTMNKKTDACAKKPIKYKFRGMDIYEYLEDVKKFIDSDPRTDGRFVYENVKKGLADSYADLVGKILLAEYGLPKRGIKGICEAIEFAKFVLFGPDSPERKYRMRELAKAKAA